VEERGKDLVNYLQLALIHGCIPAVCVDEAQRPTRFRILLIGKKDYVTMSAFFKVIGLFCLEYMVED